MPSQIEIGNWVRVKIKDCPMPKCYNCQANPRHWEFDGKDGILEWDFRHDLTCSCQHPGRTWSLSDIALCGQCKHGKVTIREEMEALRHTMAVSFEGIGARFHVNELEDLGPNFGRGYHAEIEKILVDADVKEAVEAVSSIPFSPIRENTTLGGEHGLSCWCVVYRSIEK